MIAKYATACAVCPREIRPGDEIVSLGGRGKGRWAHAGCKTGTPTPDGPLAVYTDGACSGNPGPGGWAWVVADGRQASGAERVTTNQRMEIRAVLEAVQALPGALTVVSDSTYVVKCFRDGWWRRWRTRNWMTTANKPVANRDLWEPLVDLVEERGDVTFQWVKGHSGDPLNDLADKLAVAALRSQQ